MPIRKFRRTRRFRRNARNYRKRPSRTYKIARTAAKKVFNKMAEKKFFRQNVSGSLPNSGYYYPIFDGLPQGTSISTRIGGETRFYRWYFKGYVDFTACTSVTSVRCVIVKAKNEGDPVSSSDMPTGASGVYYPLNTNVMKVLKDFQIQYTPGVSPFRKPFSMGMRFPKGKRVRYDNNSSSVAQGQIFMYMVSDKISPDGMPFLYGFHSALFSDA